MGGAWPALVGPGQHVANAVFLSVVFQAVGYHFLVLSFLATVQVPALSSCGLSQYLLSISCVPGRVNCWGCSVEPNEAKTLPGEMLSRNRILPRVSSGLCEHVGGVSGETPWKKYRWSQSEGQGEETHLV